MKTILFIFFSLLRHCSARPWEVQKLDTPYTGTFVPHIIRELDTLTASFLSQSQVPIIGAGAALAYLGYAGAAILTSDENKPHAMIARSLEARSTNASSDFLNGIAAGLVQETLERTESAVAFRRAGARALQHGATVLRRSLNAFSRAVGTVYSALMTGQRALGSNCVAERLCRIGQMTGMRWPLLGVLLRSIDSVDMDQFARALIDGTTIGDCRALYPECPD